MSKTITLDVSETLLEQAQQEANQTGQPVEIILAKWLERGADATPYFFYALHDFEGAAAAAELMKMLETQSDEKHGKDSST